SICRGFLQSGPVCGGSPRRDRAAARVPGRRHETCLRVRRLAHPEEATMTNAKRALFAAALLAVASLGHAEIIRYDASLAPEVPGATGLGSVTVSYESTAHILLIEANWSGLSGTTTVAHIHCCTAAPGAGTVGVAVTP